MSITLIHQYYNKVDDLTRYSGKDNEGVISREFEWLINAYCEKRNLKLIPQFSFAAKNGKTIRPDGTIKNALRIDYGYWESKANVDFEDEIRKKFNAGYPSSNILFENAKKAVLYQQGERVMEVEIRNAKQLDKILSAFTTYEHPEVKNFNKAVENFKDDIPKIVVALREMFEKEEKTNTKFKDKRHNFWELCKNAINPDISLADVNEMLIQHILTEEIFISIFSESQFHQENNIAKELYEVEKTFFVGNTKRELLGSIRNYYEMIKAQATGIVSHTEKQTFLKAIYENFYKAYNPKGADRLGIVYTPSEIVKFMLESTDFLLEKHFGKTLSDDNVDILDPATGTGTFICDLLEYIPKQYLARKYKHEIHANEVAILPYYIANLNIEYTFQNKMGYYEEFKNSCFVDTLDNIGGLKWKGMETDKGVQTNIFGFSAENVERIKRQNDKKISVIIGNPPYNAKQQNENFNNKNRIYPIIDARIKATFIKESSAQKTSLYDMYARFFRWAMDRIDENGIICFITNNSLVDARTFDGFRKTIQNEFDYAYIIDLGGDIRKLSGKDGIWLNENNTIFGAAAAVGICLTLLVKKKSKEKLDCQINYVHPCDIRATRQEKFDFLKNTQFREIDFKHIIPDKYNNWVNQNESDFEELIPIFSKEKSEQTLFNLCSNGVPTQRDEWVYDFSKQNLANKITFFADAYTKLLENGDKSWNVEIKWSSDLKRKFEQKKKIVCDENLIIKSYYRPFSKHFWYSEKMLNDRLTQNHYDIFGENLSLLNKVIMLNVGSTKFACLSSSIISDYANLIIGSGGTKCVPLYSFDKNGNQKENITDWALEQFRAHYEDISISKENIFHYVYAVLHNPAYRSKYELNLKREFPRIPFYTDFWKWAKWGQDLMALHIDYETVAPYALVRKDAEAKPNKKKAKNLLTDTETPNPLFEEETAYVFVPKPKLKANKEEGKIEIDEITTLSGVPAAAWEYKLGNRCALEWILDQYKESKPSDATIAEHFNSYKFADYKESVIELLMRVCTVSVETVRIVGEMSE